MDRTPNIFNYIRLMQEHTPCVKEWQYKDKDGGWVTASLDECIKHNQENGAEYANVGVFRQDLKRLVEVHPSMFPNIRNGNVELDAKGLEKVRIEKMIKRVVAKVDDPQLSNNVDLSHCKTWEAALEVLKERNELITAYRDYVETCNSLIFLYNLLTPEVNEYLTKREIIAGTGHSVGEYEKLTDYYQEVSNCKNLIKRGCEEIIISVSGGTITNVQLVGRGRKDKPNVPLLDKNTNVRCRINPHEDTMCLISDKPLPKQNYSLQLLNLYIDPNNVWENVEKMSFHYEPDSDYLYTFVEVRNNIMSYLQAVSKYEIREKNTFSQSLCNRLGSLFRFIIESESITIKKRIDAWNFICDLWNFDGDFRAYAYEYIRKFHKNNLPIQFTIKAE